MANDLIPKDALDLLVKIRDEKEFQFRKFCEVLKAYNESHLCHDEKTRASYYDRALFISNSVSKLLKKGKTLFGVRYVIEQRYEKYNLQLTAEKTTKPDCRRWCRVCGMIQDMILESTRAGDFSFLFTAAMPIALDILKDGVVHEPDEKGNVAFALSEQEISDMILASKKAFEALETSATLLGAQGVAVPDGMLSEFIKRYDNVRGDDFLFKLFFNGSRTNALFSPHELIKIADFFSLLRSLVCRTEDAFADWLVDARLFFDKDMLYNMFLLLSSNASIPLESPRQLIVDFNAVTKAKLSAFVADIERDYPEIKKSLDTSELRFQNYKDELWAIIKRNGLKGIPCFQAIDHCAAIDPTDPSLLIGVNNKPKRLLTKSSPDVVTRKSKKANSRTPSGKASFITVNLDQAVVVSPDGVEEPFGSPGYFPIIVILLHKFTPLMQPFKISQMLEKIDAASQEGDCPTWCKLKIQASVDVSPEGVSAKLREIKKRLERRHLQKKFGDDCRLICDSRKHICSNWEKYFTVKWVYKGITYNRFPVSKLPTALRSVFVA